jgi:hypothetical protein
MNDEDRAKLVAKASNNTKNLTSNDLHDLKGIMSSGLQPFYGSIRNFLDKAHGNDDAVILKVALLGEGSLSDNEKYRLNEAGTKRGRRLL